jgi:hypothetical protein
MMPPEIQAKIDQLYADMALLMAEYGMKPKSIAQRYSEALQKKAELSKPIARPRFKLPKL